MKFKIFQKKYFSLLGILSLILGISLSPKFAAAEDAEMFLQLPNIAPTVPVAGDTSGTIGVQQDAVTGDWVAQPVVTTTSLYASGSSVGGWIHFPAFFKYPGDKLGSIRLLYLSSGLQTGSLGSALGYGILTAPANYTPPAGECTDGSAPSYPAAVDIDKLLQGSIGLTVGAVGQFPSTTVYFTNTTIIASIVAPQTGYPNAGDTDVWVCMFPTNTSVTFKATTGLVTLYLRRTH